MKHSLYSYLFENIQTYNEDDVSEEEVMDDIYNFICDEVLNVSPQFKTENEEIKFNRIDVINTFLRAILPEYQIYVNVDHKKEKVLEISLVES